MHDPAIIRAALATYDLNDGTTCRQIALKHGVAYSTLLSWVRSRNRKMEHPVHRARGRPQQHEPTARQKHALSLAKLYGPAEAARLIGCSRNAVWKMIHRWPEHYRESPPPFKAGDVITFGRNGSFRWRVVKAEHACGTVSNCETGVRTENFGWWRDGKLAQKVSATR